MAVALKPNTLPHKFIGHKGPVHSLAITPSSNTIVSGSADSTIRIWKNSVESISQCIKSHNAPVKSVTLSTDG